MITLALLLIRKNWPTDFVIPALIAKNPAIDLQEQISLHAYDLYERRGCEEGRDTEDWLQAEAESAAERNTPLPVAAGQSGP